MKTFFKNSTAALTALILSLSVFAACATGQPPSTPVTTEEATEITVTPVTSASIVTASPVTSAITTESAIPQTDPPITEPVTTTEAEIPEPVTPDFEIKLSFAGDVMLASNLDKLAANNFKDYAQKKDPSYFLEKVGSYFDEDDFSLVNLECVLSDNNLSPISKSGDRVFWFKGPASNANIITSYGIEAVSLSNNHAGDYGNKGRKDTIAAVEAVGLIWGNDTNTIYYEKNGYRIAIITSGLWSTSWWTTKIAPRLEEAKENSDFQIIYWHGGTEGTHTPENWKVKVSREMVDAGADLVIGNHPHVLQPREIYNGVPILYSIGNFCYGGSKSPENRTVIYQYTLNISGKDLELLSGEETVIPCYVYTGSSNNYQPAPIEDEKEKQKVLDFLNGLIKSPL